MENVTTLELFARTRNHQIIHQLNEVYAPIVSAQSSMWQVIPDVLAHGNQQTGITSTRSSPTMTTSSQSVTLLQPPNIHRITVTRNQHLDVNEWLSPWSSYLCQTTVGSLAGSNACTIIAVLAELLFLPWGKPFSTKATTRPQCSTPLYT